MRFLRVFVVLFLIVGCATKDDYTGEEAFDLQEELMTLREKNATIENYQQEGDIVNFLFSDTTVIGIDVSKSPVLSVGIQGYWRCNGILTDVALESDEIYKYLKKDEALLGVVEGYEQWVFYFNDNKIISFEKTLFESDPDLHVRGINHRGYSVEAPENTLPAYRLSKLNGFHYAEADIRFSLDGIPVLLHDETVGRTSDGSGAVNELLFEELRSLDFGGWKSVDFKGTRIPSLMEFLALCRDIDLCPYIELKTGTKSQIETVVKLVEDYGLKGKAIYISFSSSLLEYVIGFDQNATVGFLTGTISESGIQTTLRLSTGSNYVFISTSDYSNSAVAMCMTASVPMEVWTIDSIPVIKSLSSYISGVTSNRYHAGRVQEL